jgi:gliding motility-associated-like protein
VTSGGSATNNAQISWSIVSTAGVTYASGTAPYTGNVCLPNGCYTVNMTDSGNNGWGSANLTVTPTGGTAFGPFTLASGGSGTASFCATAYTGAAPTLDDYVEVATDEVSFIAVSDADASFSWSGTPCTGGAPVTLNPVTPGGTWQVNCTGCFDPTTLVFNPAAAGAGSVPVTYTVPGTCFADVVTNNIVVGVTPTPVFTGPQNLCIGTNFDYNTTPPFGSWTASCGPCINQNTGFFFSNTAGSGSHTITFTSVGACPGTASTVVNVGPPQSATLAGPTAVCSGQSVEFTSTLPGTWSSNCIGCMNSSTGVFAPGLAFTGNYTITFVPNVACPTGNSTAPIQVNPGVAIQQWSVPEVVCADAEVVELTTDAPGGTWTSTCGSCLSADGLFDPAQSGTGTFGLSYMVANAACADSMSWDVLVSEDLAGTYSGLASVCSGQTVDLTYTLVSGSNPSGPVLGTWSVPGCPTCLTDGDVFSGSTAGTYPVVFDFEGTCDTPVQGSIEVVLAPDASITAPEVLCETAAPVTVEAATPGGTWEASCANCFSSNTLNPASADSDEVVLTYTVTTACTATETAVVAISPELGGTFLSLNPLCQGEQGVLDFTFDADLPLDAQLSASGSWSSPNCPSCILNAGAGTFFATTPGTIDVVYTFDSACSQPISGSVIVDAPVDASVTPVSQLCESEDEVQLAGAQPGGVWTASCGDCVTSTGLFSPSDAGPGSHTVTYSITGTCSDTDSEVVQVAIQRDATIDLQDLICLDAETWLATAGWPNGVWSADCVGCISATTGEIDLVAAGIGPLEVTYTLDGLCGDQDTVEVFIEGCTVEFVNVFTPNGDGMNEALQFPYLPQFPDHLLRIFDRWGQLVLESTAYQNNWTGEGAAEGTYYYTLTIENFGTFSGDFTLLR